MPSNNLILLYPCSLKPKLSPKHYFSVSIQRLPSLPPVSLRLIFEASLQTFPASFNRRLSQYLHRCPLLVGGWVRVGDYSYRLSSFLQLWRVSFRSVPSKPVVLCMTDSTVMFHQTHPEDTANELVIQPPPKSLSFLRCPLPGLEDAYRSIVTSILYHVMYPSVKLYKGILISGDHGLGKSTIVQSLFSADW